MLNNHQNAENILEGINERLLNGEHVRATVSYDYSGLPTVYKDVTILEILPSLILAELVVIVEIDKDSVVSLMGRYISDVADVTYFEGDLEDKDKREAVIMSNEVVYHMLLGCQIETLADFTYLDFAGNPQEYKQVSIDIINTDNPDIRFYGVEANGVARNFFWDRTSNIKLL